MWIKICGMTTPEAVDAAINAGVDAIGFVFAESPRRLTPSAARELAAPARGRVRCIAVTQHPSQKEIDEVLEVFRPDCLQTDAEDFLTLRLPRELERMPVLRAGRAEPQPLPVRLLYEGPVSGTGLACDWSSAREIARRAQIVLAGGLNAENVAAAISEVRPFGVDVSSGVEERRGVKSPAKIAAFVESARAGFSRTLS
ncbi:MAG TPA: phosphoribosylanthranilate isomerase [Steroidobacteraceae bacterium]